MQILSTNQIRKADLHTLASLKISSTDLMERAAKTCFEWLIKHMRSDAHYAVLCGPGNNGGDGWVIARLLKNAGKKVHVFALDVSEISQDNAINKERFLSSGNEYSVLRENSAGQMHDATVIIDALFGNGLNRAVDKELASLIRSINHLKALRISIDSPSGFFTEIPMHDKADAIHAHHTLCFHSPRLMFLFPESQQYVGNWHVLNIGLIQPETADFMDDPFSKFQYNLLPDLREMLLKPKQFAHKGNNGHALIIGGSHGKTGAVVMATKACIRSGVGLCSSYIPAESYSILQTSVPEAMVFTSEEMGHLSGSFNPEPFGAIGFGPGAGLHDDTVRLFKNLLQNTSGSLVIDADGLNILAENKTWLSFIPNNSILTPHPGELDRLTQKANSGFVRLENARELSRKSGAIVVLKGAFTAVCNPSGEVHFNSTGNAGMAKGGSGDVLTGLLTGLLARGIPALHSAKLAVFIHGLAGDIACEKKGVIAMHAGDILDSISDAWISAYQDLIRAY
jgi:NAD(P)H-hydrate epimerase